MRPSSRASSASTGCARGAEGGATAEGPRSDETRRALNEAVARAANEVAQAVAESWDPPVDPLDVRCECSRGDCDALVRLSLAEYEEVRRGARQFVVLPDHVDPTLDRVVGAIRGYALVEKTGPEGEAVAEATDPRSRS